MSSADAHCQRAHAFQTEGKLEEAVAEYRVAIAREPDNPSSHYNLGIILDDLGMTEEALVALREARRLDPDDGATRNSLALVLASGPARPRADYDEALVHATKAVALAPERGNRYTTLALAEYRMGHWTESLAASEQCVAIQQTGDGFTGFLAALAHWQKGEELEARRCFEEAVTWIREINAENALLSQLWTEAAELLGEGGPGAGDAQRRRARALHNMGKLTEAVAEYRAAIRLQADNAQTYTNLGNALWELGRPDEAIAEFRAAIRLEPDNAGAHYGLGVTLSTPENPNPVEAMDADVDAERRQLWAEAAELLGQPGPDASEKGPPATPEGAHTKPSLFSVVLAACRNFLRGRWSSIGNGRGKQPDDAEAHFTRGTALLGQGKLKEAIAEYREVTRIKPDLVEAHLNLGSVLEAAGKLEEAMAEFQTAARLRPGDERAHAALGNALRSQGRYQDSMAVFMTAFGQLPLEQDEAGEEVEPPAWTESDPDAAAQAYYERGSAHRARASLAHAVKAFRRAIRFQPNHAAAHSDLAWCLALLLEPPGPGSSEALVHARKSVELEPQRGNSQRALALAEFRAGHWSESVAAAEQSMALKRGGNAHDWFILALARCHRGEQDEARAWFKKAVAWTSDKSPKDLELRQLWSEAAPLLGEPGPPDDGP